MRLIQAKVSDEQFKAFSHYLVEEDMTVGEAVIGWIEEHCGGDHKLTRTVQVKPGVIESVGVAPAPSKPVVVQSNVDGTCSLCKKTGVKTALNKDRKWVCYECAGVKS